MFASQLSQPLDFNKHPGIDSRGFPRNLEAWEVVEDVRDHADHPGLLSPSELPDILHSCGSRAFASRC